nr:Caab117 [Calliteara abietis nucleopolyhedrovirus]
MYLPTLMRVCVCACAWCGSVVCVCLLQANVRYNQNVKIVVYGQTDRPNRTNLKSRISVLRHSLFLLHHILGVNHTEPHPVLIASSLY